MRRIAFVGVLALVGQTVKEGGRRKLFLVAYHHQLAGTGDGAIGILGTDLRSLVNDQQVKLDRFRRQKLGNGDRAHEKHGLDPLHHGAGTEHDPADGHVASLAGNLAPDDAHFPVSTLRQLVEMARQNQGRYSLEPIPFALLERIDQLMAVRIEQLIQVRSFAAGVTPTGFGAGVVEFVLCAGRLEFAF